MVSFALKVQLEEERAASHQKPPTSMTEKDISPIMRRNEKRDQLKGKPQARILDCQVSLEHYRHDRLRNQQFLEFKESGYYRYLDDFLECELQLFDDLFDQYTV